MPDARTALDPDLVECLVLPVRKQTDAIGASGDFIEMGLQLLERQSFVDTLLYLKRLDEIQRQLDDHPQSAKRDDHPVKLVGILAARTLDQLPVGVDDLQRRHG